MTLRVEVPGERTVNIEPCKCKQYELEAVKNENKINKGLKLFIKDAWAFRSKITVEPFVLCYVLPSVLSGFAVQNLCLEKSCIVNLQYDQRTCSHIMQGRTYNYTVEERNVQTMVTNMTAWSFPLQTALPGILAFFVGAWSDRTGNRKVFMVLPILGKLISIIGIILCTVFFLQVGVNETALIEGLPPALAGGRVAMTMAVYSYIADITTVSERTFRLGIITAILTLSRPIGLALSGIMTNRVGYYGVFTTACFFYMVGFIYILLRVTEKPLKTVKTVDTDKKQNVFSVFCIKDLVATINVAFQKRPGTHRLQIIFILLAYMLVVGPVIGEAQMMYWFTRYKFKFTEVDYSLFLTYSVLVGTIGSFVTIYLLSKLWKVDDTIIGVVACLSRIAGSVMFAVAPDRTIFFIGPVLDMFSSAGATSLRSIGSKLVNANEVGKTSSLISISEALVPVIYAPVYSKVYLATLSTFPGAFFFISAGLAIPAIAVLITLYFLRRKDTADIPSKEDIKPKQNEITRF